MARRLHVDYGWSSILIKISYALFFIAALVGLAYYYIPLIKKTQAFERELSVKQLALQQEEEKNAKLKKEIELLKKDPDYVEKIVRDKLGYARDGETIYRFQSLQDQQKAKEKKPAPSK
ncbi:MAG: septum formation initiator family protein [Verrucomicrobiae bacterium]|nr:septum formation initiator family protein [Verrucomicrobiae bacterium]